MCSPWYAGCGIDPELVSSLFAVTPLSEQTASTGDINRYDGNPGLGLYNAKKLVQAHNGTMKADSSKDGTGATITIVLPQLSSDTVDVEGETPVKDSAGRLSDVSSDGSNISAGSGIQQAVASGNTKSLDPSQ